ncbi:hypothetical protein DFJ73DRAFT_869772 [Zopfochytrium polystomum]|nr:hypothetical protein DFJ73DRAFT_869772 [Zopfochytrium polystomum]
MAAIALSQAAVVGAAAAVGAGVRDDDDEVPTASASASASAASQGPLPALSPSPSQAPFASHHYPPTSPHSTLQRLARPTSSDGNVVATAPAAGSSVADGPRHRLETPAHPPASLTANSLIAFDSSIPLGPPSAPPLTLSSSRAGLLASQSPLGTNEPSTTLSAAKTISPSSTTYFPRNRDHHHQHMSVVSSTFSEATASADLLSTQNPISAASSPQRRVSEPTPILQPAVSPPPRSPSMLNMLMCCFRRAPSVRKRPAIENVRVQIQRNDRGIMVVKTVVVGELGRDSPALLAQQNGGGENSRRKRGLLGIVGGGPQEHAEYEYEDDVLEATEDPDPFRRAPAPMPLPAKIVAQPGEPLSSTRGTGGRRRSSILPFEFSRRGSVATSSPFSDDKAATLVRPPATVQPPSKESAVAQEETEISDTIAPAGTKYDPAHASGGTIAVAELSSDRRSIFSFAVSQADVAEAAAEMDDAIAELEEIARTCPESLRDRFLFTGLLGFGTNALVAAATQRSTGRPVAIKIVRKSAFPAEGFVYSSAFKSEIPIEAEALNAINHINVVRFIELVSDDAFVFIVMERAQLLTWRLGPDDPLAVANPDDGSKTPAPGDNDPASDARSIFQTIRRHRSSRYAPSISTTRTFSSYRRRRAPTARRKADTDGDTSQTIARGRHVSSSSMASRGLGLLTGSPRMSADIFPEELLSRRPAGLDSLDRSTPFDEQLSEGLGVTPFDSLSKSPLPPLPLLQATTPFPQDPTDSPVIPSLPTTPAMLPPSSSRAPSALPDTADGVNQPLTRPRHSHPGDLYDFLTMYGATPLPVQRHLFRQILNAYGAVREAGFVHLDFRGENILVDDDLKVLLCDFEQARRWPPTTTRPNPNPNPNANADAAAAPTALLFTQYGTLEASCPEMLVGRGATGPAADMWALGLVLFLIATGGDEAFASEDEAAAAAVAFPEGFADDACRDLIGWMLCADPASRVASVDEVLAHPWFEATATA